MKLIGLLLVIAISAGAGFLVLNLTAEKEPEQKVKIVKVPEIKVQEVPTVDIVVARQDLPVGTVIEPIHLDRQPWPTHLKLDPFIVTDGEGDANLLGMVVRSGFNANEPIIMTKLANPKDPSFLAASISEGMRAVTISSDVISGVAGFIFPGDRVDILITQNVATGAPQPGRPAVGQQITEVLIPNVKVLATDQRASIEGGQQPKPAGSITLELTKSDAQKVRLANSMGQLSLALRSLQDKEDKNFPPPTTVSDLSRITPPSFFPVLYDGGSNSYNPPMIDVFGTADADQDESEMSEQDILAGEEKLRQSLAQNANATREDIASLGVGMTAGGMASEITVVRGAKAETVGVDRP